MTSHTRHDSALLVRKSAAMAVLEMPTDMYVRAGRRLPQRPSQRQQAPQLMPPRLPHKRCLLIPSGCTSSPCTMLSVGVISAYIMCQVPSTCHHRCSCNFVEMVGVTFAPLHLGHEAACDAGVLPRAGELQPSVSRGELPHCSAWLAVPQVALIGNDVRLTGARINTFCLMVNHIPWQVKGNAEELKDAAAKTGTQAGDAAEQAAVSAEASTSGSQQDGAQGTSAQGASSRQPRESAGAQQEPDKAQGAGTRSEGAAAVPGLMERLRSMAGMVQREVRPGIGQPLPNLVFIPGELIHDGMAKHLLAGIDGSCWQQVVYIPDQHVPATPMCHMLLPLPTLLALRGLAPAPLLVVLELVSYCFRAISLGARLFANMMAGHALGSAIKMCLGRLISWTVAAVMCRLLRLCCLRRQIPQPPERMTTPCAATIRTPAAASLSRPRPGGRSSGRTCKTRCPLPQLSPSTATWHTVAGASSIFTLQGLPSYSRVCWAELDPMRQPAWLCLPQRACSSSSARGLSACQHIDTSSPTMLP